MSDDPPEMATVPWGPLPDPLGFSQLTLRWHVHRFTIAAQIDGTLCRGTAWKTRNGRERARRKALAEYRQWVRSVYRREEMFARTTEETIPTNEAW